MFQFCLKISCLPFLRVYSMLLTLLSSYPKPCLAFLFGLVMLPESFLIILLPLESSKQGAKTAPQAGKVSLRAPRDPCSSPQILLTFQQKAAGVNYWLQKSQWQRFNLWKVKSSPLFTCLLHTSVLSRGAAVLMLFSCKVPVIAIPLTFISTEQKLPSSNLETCL